tara:strand:- start:1211 stop:2485 length:1275 start_codon:yes stop_codon:yes gene_type:complete
MNFKPVNKLPNMEDIPSEIIQKRNNLLYELGSFLNLHGYNQVETPIIEETELFIRKSGGELSNKLYSFVEPGGINVSLRPEITSGLVRTANRKINTSKNLRFYYNGPVFRYSSPDEIHANKSRQYTQFGAELFGSKSIHSDAEILSIAIKGLHKIGINNPKICIFNMNVINEILSIFNISDRGRLFLIKNVDDIKILSNDEILNKAKSIGIIKNIKIQKNINSSKDSINGFIGRRTKSDIINRIKLKENLFDEKDRFLSALKFVKKMYKISGTPDKSLSQFSKLLNNYDDKFKVFSQYFKDLINALEIQQINISNIILDFGLSKSISYYNGLIFDIFVNNKAIDSVASGGRYDDLNNILGYKNNLPALGFAYNIDEITKILKSEEKQVSEKILKQTKDNNMKDIISKANKARESGFRSYVEYID